MEWVFEGRVLEWRGPAPYLFVPMTKRDSEDVKELAAGVIYWGQVPVIVTIGETEFTTAMWPKDGRYLVPIKVAVQRSENIGAGDRVRVRLRIAGRS
jgi:uncharacterized protein DUF1905